MGQRYFVAIEDATGEAEVLKELTVPSEIPLTVEGLAFDGSGRPFGLDENGEFVHIDLESGVVTVVDAWESRPEESSQEEYLVWNSDEERFYLFLRMADDSSWQAVASLGRWDSEGVFEVVAELPGLEEFYVIGLLFYEGRLILSAMPYYDPWLLEEEGANEATTYFFSFDENWELVAESETPFFAYLVCGVNLSAQPDVQIGPARNRLIGQDFYSESGSGQTARTRSKSRRLVGSFHAILENDGSGAGVFSLNATGGGARDRVTYMLDGENVTALVLAGMELPLASGSSADLKVAYSRPGKGVWKETFRVTLSGGDLSDTGLFESRLETPKSKKAKPRRPVRPTSLFH